MTPPSFVDQQSRGSTQLIETLLEYALKYAAGNGEPRDGRCWDAITSAKRFLEGAPSDHIRIGVGNSDRAWLGLPRDLLDGISEGEFSIQYQPIWGISTQTVIGVEALARWHHPVHGSVPPSTFVPAAERTGAIHALGRWILAEGCRQMRLWESEGLHIPYLSVNVSPLQLIRDGFVAGVDDAVTRSEMPYSKLALEVTEGVSLAHHDAVATQVIRELRHRGIRIMIDDFGTGFASLSYLQHLPFDAIKIDRRFVAKLPSSRNDREIIKAIVDLSGRLGMNVIAEGVETREQETALIEAGCDQIQGWLISPALSPLDLQERCSRGQLATANQLFSS
ncbi:putative bifunctional diguanylate cyclase/phosphodiesterase [Burkholderia lata]|uniref:putative bifunctional diguanylate cyclase/phosphodiesterase n=1 Tax=Burkholderia lata (strain ATCC 17760 / DSM 23089 / LMG 22485 / NCIMB 9086 / R18194 / 383) TaxID=482957 RepID=UPI00158147D4|nr:EAL domain-containing protein [Burkholderia lata]